MQHFRLAWHIGKDDPWLIAACVAGLVSTAALILGILREPISTRYALLIGLLGISIFAYKGTHALALCRRGQCAEAQIDSITNQSRGCGVVHYQFNANGQKIDGNRELFLEDRPLMVVYDPRNPERHIALWEPKLRNGG